MKFKIVEKQYGDGIPYYIVDVNRWYGWGVYNRYMYDGIISDLGLFGDYDHIRFGSVEQAELAIERMQKYLKAKKHSKAIKIIE